MPRIVTPGRRPVAATLIAIFALVISLSSGPLSAQQTGDVLGQLIDQESGRPVPGALVSLVGTNHQATSDPEGFFRLRALPAGKYRLQVVHIAYGPKVTDLTVGAGAVANIKVSLSETAIALEPLTVEAVSLAEQQMRGTGYSRRVATRADFARAEGTNMNLVDVLQSVMPSIRVGRSERVVGQSICIELRGVRMYGMAGGCLSPAVFLNGAEITNAIGFYENLDVREIERIEIIPMAEANVRYGTRARYGAMLIETRTATSFDPRAPGSSSEASANPKRQANFNWEQDQQGHRTPLVYLASAAGNAAGAAAGLAIARTCLHLRQPSNDGIVSDCDALTSVGVGLAALALPALGSSIATRMAGQTDLSRGEFMPATIGAAMVILPGYALAMSAKRNNSESLQNVSYVIIAVGAPFAATAADYLFRKLKKQD